MSHLSSLSHLDQSGPAPGLQHGFYWDLKSLRLTFFFETLTVSSNQSGFTVFYLVLMVLLIEEEKVNKLLLDLDCNICKFRETPRHSGLNGTEEFYCV